MIILKTQNNVVPEAEMKEEIWKLENLYENGLIALNLMTEKDNKSYTPLDFCTGYFTEYSRGAAGSKGKEKIRINYITNSREERYF